MEDRRGRTDLGRWQDVDKQRREEAGPMGQQCEQRQETGRWSVLGDRAEKITPGLEKSRGELDTAQGLLSPLRILHNRDTRLRR